MNLAVTVTHDAICVHGDTQHLSKYFLVKMLSLMDTRNSVMRITDMKNVMKHLMSYIELYRR